MAEELVKDLRELSLSAAPSPDVFVPLNKRPFKIVSAADEFASISPFKASFRVLLNFKDMNTLQLKAGSLLRIKISGIGNNPTCNGDRIVLSNVFECWPSVIVPQSSLGVGRESIKEWCELQKINTSNVNAENILCEFMLLLPKEKPFPTALKLQIASEQPLTAEQMQMILKWLSTNQLISVHKSWYFLPFENENFEQTTLHFSITCIDTGIVAHEEADIVKYCPETTKIVQPKVDEVSGSRMKDVAVKFGGLKVQVDELESIIERVVVSVPRQNPLIRETRGVLLYGPPGTGKTLMVRHLTAKYNLPVLHVTASDFSHAAFGEAEVKLQETFDSAQKMAPSVIFMDEIDSLCPKRDSHSSPAAVRLTTLLLTLMDGCNSSASASPVLFIAATNAVNSLDPALRRPGRFDREIEIPPPNRDDRFSILSALMRSYPGSVVSEQELNRVADICHGFVGADLSLLCKEAFLSALIRSRDNQNSSQVTISYDDFITSLSRVKPSAMREVFVEVPKTKWSDIGGQSETKQKLIECVEWPIKYPDRFERLGIRPPKGVLLFGPPGCSKTLLAKALASESGLNFLAVKGPEIFSKYVGESEKKIRDIFRKARQASPAIIFFDEFDSIAGRSAGTESSNSVADRVMSQLLNEMDGIESLVNVIVIAATNKPDLIDKALLRPGRFDRHIYIAPPDAEARAEIFKIISRKMPFDPSISPETVSRLTDGFTGAELTAVCQNAALRAIERDISTRTISFDDLSYCISKFEKQLDPDSLKLFEKFIE